MIEFLAGNKFLWSEASGPSCNVGSSGGDIVYDVMLDR